MLDHGLKTKLPLALFALLLGGPLNSHAADLYEGPGLYRTPAPYASTFGPPVGEVAPDGQGLYRERFSDFPRCRWFHRVWVDSYGHEVLRRMWVCDERTAMRVPGWAAAPPQWYGYAPRVRDVPRSTRNIGPAREFDDLNSP